MELLIKAESKIESTVERHCDTFVFAHWTCLKGNLLVSVIHLLEQTQMPLVWTGEED